MKATCQGFCPESVHEIYLVEHHEPGDMVKADISQYFVHGLHLLFEPRIADVHYMQDQVRILHFIKGGAECPQKVFGQVTDETNSVGDDHLAVSREAEPSRGRIERCKEQVLCLDLGLRERVEESGLTGICITRYRDNGYLTLDASFTALVPCFTKSIKLV